MEEEYEYFNPNLTIRRRKHRRNKKSNETKKKSFENRKLDNHIRRR